MINLFVDPKNLVVYDVEYMSHPIPTEIEAQVDMDKFYMFFRMELEGNNDPLCELCYRPYNSTESPFFSHGKPLALEEINSVCPMGLSRFLSVVSRIESYLENRGWIPDLEQYWLPKMALRR